jgi:hypothetical protein
MTVFVVQEPFKFVDGVPVSKVDLRPAMEFGELEILAPAGNTLLNTVPLIRSLRDKLRNFSDDDLILPMGDPAIIMLVGIIAAEVNHGRIRVLRWDKKRQEYHTITLQTGGN